MVSILIVDDDTFFAEMLAKRLQRELTDEFTFETHIASTVEEAKRLLVSLAAAETGHNAIKPIDVILTDNKLGSGQSGLDWLEELHQTDLAIDSILFTGLNEEVGLRAAEIGIYRYIVKPFEPQELIWSVRALLRQRSRNYERQWLEVLNQVGAALQKVQTVDAVGDALVQGGVDLGFQRVQLWRVIGDDATAPLRPDDETTGKPDFFQGFKQAGEKLLDDFEQLRMPYAESIHVRQTYDTKTIQFYEGWRFDKGYLASKLGMLDSPPKDGDWACIPLLRDDRCIGIIVIHNPKQPRKFQAEERRLLTLYAQQAGAAWERASIHAERIREQKAVRSARRIIERTSINGEPGEFDNLLKTVYRAIKRVIPTRNFVVVMKHRDKAINEQGWLHYCFHLKDGQPQQPYWRPPQDRRLNHHIINHKQRPRYFRDRTVGYRRKYGLALPDREVKSLIALPLVVGNESIGGIFIEDYQQTNRWEEERVTFAIAVLQQLAHYLQSAWINHQRKRLNEQLGLLQIANEQIMKLAQQQPANLPAHEWLWHATLTLSTASYGFGFNRALLFLVEEEETLLQGRMGIGHLTVPDAKRAWEKDKAVESASFEDYLAQLKSGQLETVTPADARVRAMRFPAQSSSAFARVMAERRQRFVARKDAKHELPATFVEHFGEHDYWLVPANAGNRLVAILILDIFCETDPPQTFALKYIDALTNEAALIHESLQRSQAQEQLLAVTSETLSNATTAPLPITLQKIARAARLVTNANSVAIYPLQADMTARQFDKQSIVWSAENSSLVPNRRAEPSRFMNYLFEQGKPMAVSDVTRPLADGICFAADPVVQETGVKSFIGVPIYGQRTGGLRGLIYFNYHWQRTFTDDDLQMGKAFANLVSVALRNWREHQGLRIEKESREEELRILLHILQTALEPEVDELLLIETLLQQTRAFFHSLDPKGIFSIALFLRTWERKEGTEPAELRRQYYLGPTGISKRTDHEELTGLVGEVMRTRRSSLVGDVSKDKRYRPRRTGIPAEYAGRETQSELDVPINDETGKTIGVFNVESSEKEYFTAFHEQTVIRLSRVAMLALYTVRQREFTRSIFNAGQAITAPVALEETLNVVVGQIKTLLPDLTVMTIWRYDTEQRRLVLAAHTGLRHVPEQETEEPRMEGAVNTVIQSREPVWVDDVRAHPLFRGSEFVMREALQSTAAFPLIVEGQIVGAIFFAYRQLHHFSRLEREMLPILVQFIAIGIHDAEAILRLEREKRRLRATLYVTAAGNTTLDDQQLVISAQKALLELYPDATVLFLSHERTNNGMRIIEVPGAPYPIDHPDFVGRDTLPIDSASMIGALAQASLQTKEQRHHLIPNIATRDEEPYLPLRSSTQSTVGVTIVDSAGELLGGLIVEADMPHRFDLVDVGLITGIANQIGLAMDRSRKIAAIDFRNVMTDWTIWATDLAHDLNREIYQIRTKLLNLHDESALTAEGRTTLQEIEESFDLIVQDAPDINPKIVTLPDLAPRLVQWAEEYVGLHKVSVQVAADAESVAVQLYPQSLKRTIRYLTRNAIKAMKYEGLIQVKTIKLDEESVAIQFKDSGPGIKADDPIRTRMWHERLDQEGRGGLGLLFARLHVEKLNGTIYLADFEEGCGAMFCIHLPRTTAVVESGGGDDEHGVSLNGANEESIDAAIA